MKKDGVSRGFGFVTFVTEQGMENACAFTSHFGRACGVQPVSIPSMWSTGQQSLVHAVLLPQDPHPARGLG